MTYPTTNGRDSGALAQSGAPDAVSRFYARNGDVFMTSAWGGFYLTPHETARMLDLWRSPEPDEITATVRNEMADELEAAMAEALRQTDRKIAA